MKKILLTLAFVTSSMYASIFADAINAFQNNEYNKAYSLFQRSLNNQSSIQANYFLGLMHLRGLGTPQNLDLAQQHLDIASNIGNARAQCLLAEVYVLKKETSSARRILEQPQLHNIIECEQIIQKYNIQIKAER